jgi:hypothetical protein
MITTATDRTDSTAAASASLARYWLGVVHQEHVKRGVELGIAQIGHGKRAGIARMHAGDWLIYYSPRASLTSKEPLQAFTAIGEIADEVVWQADEGDFKPWRRRVAYLGGAAHAPIGPLTGTLDLTSTPNWGYTLRRGLVELSEHDFRTIRSAMGV